MIREMKNMLLVQLNEQAEKIEKRKNSIDNTKMSFLKAIAMIWVVCSHCKGGGVSLWLNNWYSYSSHFMAIFIFISGYFYQRNLEKHPVKSILNKIKGWLIPYFIWNIFYGILVNYLKMRDLVSYGDPLSLHNLFVSPWIHGHQFVLNIPAWFVPALFTVFIITFLVRVVLGMIKQSILYDVKDAKNIKDKVDIAIDVILVIIFSCIACYSVYMCQRGYNQGIGLYIYRTGYLLPFFQLGFFYKNYIENKWEINKYLLVFMCFVIKYFLLVFFGETGTIVVWGNFGGNPIIVYVYAVIGIAFWVTVAGILEPAFRKDKIIKFFSANTFTVMMHHLMVIFCINSILFWISENIIYLSGFDVEAYKTTIYYIYNWRDSRIALFYVIAAISVPLLMRYIYEHILLMVAKNTGKQ